MEHPLIGSLDELSTDKLSETINDLGKKLSMAARTGNGHLCHQIRMAMESYQTKYQEKLQASYKKDLDNVNFDDKINIR
jgi:hypothetical protein